MLAPYISTSMSVFVVSFSMESTVIKVYRSVSVLLVLALLASVISRSYKSVLFSFIRFSSCVLTVVRNCRIFKSRCSENRSFSWILLYPPVVDITGGVFVFTPSPSAVPSDFRFQPFLCVGVLQWPHPNRHLTASVPWTEPEAGWSRWRCRSGYGAVW